MTTPSTQLRALEGEIGKLADVPSSIRQFRKSKLCDKAITIPRKELAECYKDTSAEIQSLRTENATLKRRLDEAMKERDDFQSIRTANDRLRSFLTDINILAQSRSDTELCKSTYDALHQL